jgi:CheY-like chemotaxis protein
MSQPAALIIDDNQQNLKVLAQLLAKQGVSCTEVSNPNTLSSVLPSLGEVNVVFLDLEMPGLDGFSVKDFLRTELSGVPIIAYTVHVSEMNVAQQMGFDGFIGKPISSVRFPDQLARILRGEAVWDRA